ncbi:hypothetical protein [Streptomyces glaucosporus]|uniref:coiled-coil domain-containing protein n=1 Tax=Streptomyces glaucosporus TaxID=284044 RepID=UPI0031D78353
MAAVLLATAVPAAPRTPAGAVPRAGTAGEPVGELLLRLREAHRRSEAATAAYRSTERELTAQRSRVVSFQDRLADTRVRLDEARDEAGRVARQQYRGAGTFPPHLRLLLGRDERDARAVFEYGRALDRMAARQHALAGRLAAGERRLAALASAARRILDRQRTLAARRERQRDEAGRRLAEVQRLLVSLTDEELDRLRRLEQAPRPSGGP